MDFPPDEEFVRIKIAAAGEVGDRIAVRVPSHVTMVSRVVHKPDQ